MFVFLTSKTKIMTEKKYLSLDLCKNRQVKITTTNNSVSAILYLNGVEYAVSSKAGKYVGCGIDAAHSFMGWLDDDITRTTVRKNVEVTEWPSDVRKVAVTIANGTMEVVTFGLYDSKNTKDDYFTTPHQLAVGLENMVRAKFKKRKNAENYVIRHTHGTNVEVIEKILYHLKRAMPVIALVFNGAHWVTIVGINVYYTNGKIDVDQTTVNYIDLTGGYTLTNIEYKKLDILGWSSVGTKIYESYLPGTLISLKSDSVVFEDDWTKGWKSELYSIANKKYLFLLKESDGLVHIHNMNNDGTVGNKVINYNWTKGWSKFHFYTIDNQTYLFLLKAKESSEYSSGLIHIHKMNADGTVGERIDTQSWTSGWHFIEFFNHNSKTYLFANKPSGQVNIVEMTSDGKLGQSIFSANGLIQNNEDSIDTNKLKFLQTNSTAYIYALETNPNYSNIKQFKISTTSGKLNLNLISTKKLEAGWSTIDLLKISETRSILLLNKGIDNLGSYGKMNLYEINNELNNAEFVDKPIDENIFKNAVYKIEPFSSNTVTGFSSQQQQMLQYVKHNETLMNVVQVWTSIELFKSETGNKLFLLEANTGKILVLNMKADGTFEKGISDSNPLKYYSVLVETGTVDNAGTDANVHLVLIGDGEESPKFKLNTLINDFERKTTTVCHVVVDKYFNKLTDIRIGHDNTGSKPGWFVNHVEVTEGNSDNSLLFPCNKWFASDEGDKKTTRTLSSVNRQLEVRFKTADQPKAGTDANVYISLLGADWQTSKYKINTSKDDFERNSLTTQGITLEKHQSNIEQVIVEHDNTGENPGWFLDFVEIEEKATKKLWTFPCNSWFSRDESDKKIKRTLSTILKFYEIKIKTGNIENAGTDAKVSLKIYDVLGNTKKMIINTAKDDFERNSITTQRIFVEDYLSEIAKIVVEHDNSGEKPGWFLEYVQIKEGNSAKLWKFTCNKWLATTVGDGKTARILYQ